MFKGDSTRPFLAQRQPRRPNVLDPLPSPPPKSNKKQRLRFRLLFRPCLEGLVGLRPHFVLPHEGGAGGHRGSDDQDGGQARGLLDELHHQGDGRPHVLQ